jgi:hypothetical protein
VRRHAAREMDQRAGSIEENELGRTILQRAEVY